MYGWSWETNQLSRHWKRHALQTDLQRTSGGQATHLTPGAPRCIIWKKSSTTEEQHEHYIFKILIWARFLQQQDDQIKIRHLYHRTMAQCVVEFNLRGSPCMANVHRKSDIPEFIGITGERHNQNINWSQIEISILVFQGIRVQPKPIPKALDHQSWGLVRLFSNLPFWKIFLQQ